MPQSLTKAGATTSSFVYGPEHQRTRQSRTDVGGPNNGITTTIYAGPQEVETKVVGSTITTTIKTYWPYGVGLEIDRARTPSNTTSELNWTHGDRLGSMVAYSAIDGSLREKLAYDAWGKRRTLTGAPITGSNGGVISSNGTPTPDTIDGQTDNKGFTGHEMLDALDLVHMNGRIYDPLTAKFLSADPILQDPMNGQSYNRYAYVMNNPTNFTDPTGFAACAASTGSRLCNEEQKTIASGNYVMNNIDGSRTQFSGGKQVLKTDGQGNVLFNAKAPQANANAVPPPPAGGDITKVPTTSYSFGVREKVIAAAELRGERLTAGPVTASAAAIVLTATKIVAHALIPDNPLEAGAQVAFGLFAKIASLGKGANSGVNVVKPGEFLIVDWAGYPAGVPKPTGPFQLLEGAEYNAARDAANSANRTLRKDWNLVGKPVDIHEIQPVKFNGSPTNEANKIILDRSLHRQEVTPWWNSLQRAIEGKK